MCHDKHLIIYLILMREITTLSLLVAVSDFRLFIESVLSEDSCIHEVLWVLTFPQLNQL